MTSAQEQILRARDLVRGAADHWDAADLAGIGNSVSILDACVANLTDASWLLNASQDLDEAELRASLLGL
jgi:hypothetical protein